MTIAPPSLVTLPGRSAVVAAEVAALEVTVGAVVGDRYVNNVFAALAPAGVVTITLAVPAVPIGVVQVIEVSLTTLTLGAAAPPMVTPVAPVKPVPVIVTLVPPAVLPLVGEMLVTVGGARGVKGCRQGEDEIADLLVGGRGSRHQGQMNGIDGIPGRQGPRRRVRQKHPLRVQHDPSELFQLQLSGSFQDHIEPRRSYAQEHVTDPFVGFRLDLGDELGALHIVLGDRPREVFNVEFDRLQNLQVQIR